MAAKTGGGDAAADDDDDDDDDDAADADDDAAYDGGSCSTAVLARSRLAAIARVTLTLIAVVSPSRSGLLMKRSYGSTVYDAQSLDDGSG